MKAKEIFDRVAVAVASFVLLTMFLCVFTMGDILEFSSYTTFGKIFVGSLGFLAFWVGQHCYGIEEEKP